MSPTRRGIAGLDDDDILPAADAAGAGTIPTQAEGVVAPLVAPSAPPVELAQGRPRPALTVADLPEPEETEATGDLSPDEEQLLSLCMRGIEQFKASWWVFAKAVANINSRRLYRKTHDSFEDFAQQVLGKSSKTLYEEIKAYPVGELLSARADTSFEGNSNNPSARADISKKAAAAWNPVTKTHGPEVVVQVHETIQDAAGRTLPHRELTGVITKFREQTQGADLSQEELLALGRELGTQLQNAPQGNSESTGADAALTGLRTAVDLLTRANRALAPAKVKQVLEEAPAEAAELLAEAEVLAVKIGNRVRVS